VYNKALPRNVYCRKGSWTGAESQNRRNGNGQVFMGDAELSWAMMQ